MERVLAPPGWKLSIWGYIAIAVMLVALVLVGRAAARQPSEDLPPLNSPRSSFSPAHSPQPSLYRAI